MVIDFEVKYINTASLVQLYRSRACYTIQNRDNYLKDTVYTRLRGQRLH